MGKPSDTLRDDAQLARFKEAARALERDDDKERFERKMAKIAKAKPTAKGKV